MSEYRPNVAAILQRSDEKILVAERTDVSGAWQFPQGGVDPGEDLLAALYREVEEEIGIGSDLLELMALRTGYRYKFPSGHLKKGRWRGQEQTYFLCRFLGNDGHIALDEHTREFAQFQWIAPADYDLRWLPKFKRRVYGQVFRDFFGVKLGGGPSS